MALLKGLEFLKAIGCNSITIKSYSLELIQACTGQVEVWSPYTAILANCFLKISSMSDVSFVHCLRDGST
jgi:ribonuclease HI